MSSCKKIFVRDICRNDSTYTFILESPHNDEVKYGIPASGSSGIIMSKALLGCSTPFGRLLSQNHKKVSQYSLMNASCIPLQANAECYADCELPDDMLVISESRIPTSDLPTGKKIIRKALSSESGKKIVGNFRKRFCAYLKASSCRKFIICGVMAQVIFEEAIVNGGYYQEKKTLNFCGITIDVFYENHPSDLSGNGESKWLKNGHLDKLKTFERGK